MARTLFDKLWDLHRIGDAGDGADLIAIDRVLLHERTGGVALKALREKGYRVRAPQRVLCVMDHVVSFLEGRGRDDARMPHGSQFITQTRAMAHEAGIPLIDTDDPRQGIVHVIAPELGAALPGLSLVCPDSHTCSLGALGALAWGVGSSEAEHAMATGALRAYRPKTMRVTIDGTLPEGVFVKDLALALISRYGAKGGAGYAIEFTGEAVAAMDLEARLTLCNLAVEFAAFTAIIAPDEATMAALRAKPYAPSEADWQKARAHWAELHSDAGAVFDAEIKMDASKLAPMVTWGTSPEHAAPCGGRAGAGPARALHYMGLEGGERLADLPLHGAFIGSCTNGRLSDLRAAALYLRGARVAPGVRAVCVPGSQSVRRAAEAEGLDQVFRQAGFEWGEPGCAMCFYAGGQTFPEGARVISSTNRNFEGRQGPGVRTHLASPATVAASAVAGRITDPRMAERHARAA